LSISIAAHDAKSAVEELNKLTAIDLVRMIHDRDVSPVEIVDAHL
jgi:hypothetical protein